MLLLGVAQKNLQITPYVKSFKMCVHFALDSFIAYSSFRLDDSTEVFVVCRKAAGFSSLVYFTNHKFFALSTQPLFLRNKL